MKEKKSGLKVTIILASTLSLACITAGTTFAQSKNETTQQIELRALQLVRKNKSKEAESLVLANLANKKKVPGKNKNDYRLALISTATFYRSYLAQPSKAIPYLETLVEVSKQDRQNLVSSLKLLADSYSGAGRYSDEERVLKQWVNIEKSKSAMASIEPLQKLALAQMNQNNLDEAGKNFERVKALYEKVNRNVLPKDFLVFYTRYLGLKGDMKNYKIYAAKLRQLTPTRKWDNCPACGMG